MSAMIVKQPNGLLARFSSVVDDMTHTNMTDQEMLDVLVQVMGRKDALEKIQRGLDDFIKRGLARWHDCLEQIEVIHGKDMIKPLIEKCSQDSSEMAHPVSKIVREGKLEDIRVEDNGCAIITYLEDGTDPDKESLFIQVRSWEEWENNKKPPNHKTILALMGKKLRVTIEVIGDGETIDRQDQRQLNKLDSYKSDEKG